MEHDKIYQNDCLEKIPEFADNSIDLCFTSPPYKNSYDGIGINKGTKSAKYHYSNDVGEPLYVIEDVSKLLYPKMKLSGSFLINLGFNRDSGALRPFQIVDRFRRDGWFCPDIIIWHKKNPIPNTANQLTNAYEFIFLLTKTPTYNISSESRDYIHNVIETPVEAGESEHNAAFPIELARFIVQNFSKEGDIVFDPFSGSGTTALAAKQLKRHFIGCEVNPIYCKISEKRLMQTSLEELCQKL